MPDKSFRSLCVAAIAALCACSGATLLPAVPARAQAALPPACDEPGTMKRLKRQFNDAEEMMQRTGRIKEITEVKETHYGAAPKSFNQYANSNDHILNVRWCQATLLLTDGQTDTLFWYLADEQKGDKHSLLYDHCSKRSTLDPNCDKYREHR
jgi:hypothetical protein